MTEINFQRLASTMGASHPFSRFFDVAYTNPNRSVILLFRTVIIAAIYDGIKGCPEARDWLLTPSADIQEVADLADLPCCWLRRIAHQVFTRKTSLPPYRVWRYLWADLQQKTG